MTATVLNTKISEAENTILNTSNLVTTTVLNTKITTSKIKKLTAQSFCSKIKAS